jgi:hypothetical protein
MVYQALRCGSLLRVAKAKLASLIFTKYEALLVASKWSQRCEQVMSLQQEHQQLKATTGLKIWGSDLSHLVATNV